MPVNPRATIGALLRNADGVELYFDATLDESVSVSVTWSEYALEDNTPITEHGTLAPRQIALTGVLSRLTGDARSLDDRYRTLLSFIENKELLTLISGNRVWSNLVLSSLEVTRNASDGQQLQCAIGLQSIRYATATTVDAPIAPVIEDSATPIQTAGVQQPQPATEKEEESLFDYINNVAGFNYLKTDEN